MRCEGLQRPARLRCCGSVARGGRARVTAAQVPQTLAGRVRAHITEPPLVSGKELPECRYVPRCCCRLRWGAHVVCSACGSAQGEGGAVWWLWDALLLRLRQPPTRALRLRHDGPYASLCCVSALPLTASVPGWMAKCAREGDDLKWLAQYTKECPKCKALIHKDGGCQYMTCSTCQHKFCWHAVASLRRCALCRR